MKKLFTAVSVLGLVLFFSGCSSKHQNVQIDDKSSVLIDAPEWVGDPKLEGYIVEVGSANPNSKNDLSFQRAEAMADARDNLARLLKLQIKNSIQAYKEKNEEEELKEHHVLASLQSIELMVRQSSQQKLWISKTGQMFILVGIEKSTLQSGVNKHLMLKE